MNSNYKKVYAIVLSAILAISLPLYSYNLGETGHKVKPDMMLQGNDLLDTLNQKLERKKREL